MDGKKRVRLSGAEYRKRAKEKDDKQKDTIKKTRKLDDFFGKPSTDIKDPIIDPTLDVPSSSGAPSTDDPAVSSSENTLIDVASISKEQAEDVPLVPGVAGVGVQPNPPDQELYEISDDPAKWTVDEFTRDHICKNGANQNIQNDFPKSETRENFDDFEKKAKKLSFIQEYEKDFRRNQKRKLLPGETNTGEEMQQKNGRENFRINTFLVVIDTLSEELKRRRDAYKLLYNKFHFITNLTNLSISEVEDKAKALQMIYSTDLEDNFTEECLHFRSHCSIKNEERKSAVSLLKWLRTEGLQIIYPNVDIALRMCVCTPASNCTGERSFSCLRRVKNYLRTSMTEQRLNDLALLNIEADFLSKLDCEDLINDFAALKCR